MLYYMFRVLHDVEKILARIYNWARSNYLKFVFIIVFSPILSFVKMQFIFACEGIRE